MKIYTKKHLLDRLQQEGLPYSYKSLLKYEKAGVIPNDSRADVEGARSSMRFYTDQEIEQIVQNVKNYKTKNQ